MCRTSLNKKLKRKIKQHNFVHWKYNSSQKLREIVVHSLKKLYCVCAKEFDENDLLIITSRFQSHGYSDKDTFHPLLNTTSLRHLDISSYCFNARNCLNEEELIDLEKIFHHNDFYSLNMNGCGLCGQEIGNKIISCLSTNKCLVKLNISHSYLNSIQAETLLTSPSIRELDLSSNQIKSESFLKNISQNKTIQSLNLFEPDFLRDFKIGNDGAKFLSQNTSLVILNLEMNKLTEIGAEYLSHHSSLTSLNLDFNPIGDVGAISLSHIATLKECSLNCCNIVGEGAIALNRHPTLSTLNLKTNDIPVDILKTFADNKNLKKLGISFPHKQIEQLFEALSKNLVLESICINKYTLEEVFQHKWSVQNQSYGKEIVDLMNTNMRKTIRNMFELERKKHFASILYNFFPLDIITHIISPYLCFQIHVGDYYSREDERTLDCELYDACFAGNMNWINELLFQHPKHHFNYEECLENACLGGHIDVVNLFFSLEKKDEKETEKKDEKETEHILNLNKELGKACFGGHVDIVELLIGMGANNWCFGMINACVGGHIDVVKILLKKGCDQNNTISGSLYDGYESETANNHILDSEILNRCIQSACLYGHFKLVKFMIEYGGGQLTRCHIFEQYFDEQYEQFFDSLNEQERIRYHYAPKSQLKQDSENEDLGFSLFD